MHITALILIALAVALAGRYIAYIITARVRVLEKAELMISLISNEISYVSMPSVEIVDHLTQNNDLSELIFLKFCRDLLEDGEDFPVAWRKALSEKNNTRLMRRKDVALLKAFGESFGLTDVSGQLALCDLYIETLRLYKNEALKEKERLSGPVAALGILFGIGIIVIFL